MAWPPASPIPDDPVVAGWWRRAEQVRDAEDAGAAAERAAEQAKRLRQLRRRVERIDEAIVLAQSASEARRHLRRRGLPYEQRSAGPDEVEYFNRPGRILSIR